MVDPCGRATWGSYTLPSAPPSTQLCGSPLTASTLVANTLVKNAIGEWQWGCSWKAGTGAMVNTVCYAGPSNYVLGQCGAANGATLTTGLGPASAGNLCSSGVATAMTSKPSSAGETLYAWKCVGYRGGAAASCQAQGGTYVGPGNTAVSVHATERTKAPAAATNGACGGANGSVTPTAPSGGLCATGTATAVTPQALRSGVVTGFGWTCVGAGGGTSSTCNSSVNPPPLGGTNPDVNPVTTANMPVVTATASGCTIAPVVMPASAVGPSGSPRQFLITAAAGSTISVGGTCPVGALAGNVYTTGNIATNPAASCTVTAVCTP